MVGYYRQPEMRAVAIQEGWSHTCDDGRNDDDGSADEFPNAATGRWKRKLREREEAPCRGSGVVRRIDAGTTITPTGPRVKLLMLLARGHGRDDPTGGIRSAGSTGMAGVTKAEP